MLVPTEKIYLACGATDMRKSINGLVALVEGKFSLSPFESAWFVFCNRSKDRLKILTWEENGFWLHLKRLEKGKFMWPSEDSNDTMTLTYEELQHIIQIPGIKEKLKRTAFKIV